MMLFKLALPFFAYLSQGSAKPVDVARDVTPSTLETLELMKQYADASYYLQANSPGVQVGCQSNECGMLQNRDTTVLHNFVNELAPDVSGFVALDKISRQLIVSFRGTSALQSWISASDFPLAPCSFCSGCSASASIWNSWTTSRQSVLQKITAAAAEYSEYQLVVTGHSLGGAIASLAAAQLRIAGFKASLYTYGAPRLGNEALANFITNQAGDNYRVTHYNDLVPRIPSTTSGYTHITPEYYISSAGLDPVNLSNLQLCSGSQATTCNQAWAKPDIRAHTQYFGPIGSNFINIQG